MTYLRKNWLTDKRSKKIDTEAAKLFESLCEKNGWAIVDTTKPNPVTNRKDPRDWKEHWDYKIQKGTKSYLVDIKGLKRLDRGGIQNDSLILIEFKNVNGYDGWIYGIEDYVAFELKEGFVFCERQKLLDYVLTKVDINGQVYESPTRDKKPYVLYQRSQYGRKDIFTHLTKAEILNLKSAMWRKNV